MTSPILMGISVLMGISAISAILASFSAGFLAAIPGSKPAYFRGPSTNSLISKTLY